MFNQPTEAPKGSWFSALWKRVDNLGPILLERRVVTSAVPSVNFKLTGNYDSYLVRMHSVVSATDATGLNMRMSTDNGATFDSGASVYRWATWTYTDTPTTGHLNDQADSEMTLTSTAVLGTATGENMNGEIHIWNPSSASYKVVGAEIWTKDSGARAVQNHATATYESTAVVNAISLFMITGNIASGIFKLYGVR